eukprot:9130437-Alexandrium_andersonii.AAC.1
MQAPLVGAAAETRSAARSAVKNAGAAGALRVHASLTRPHGEGVVVRVMVLRELGRAVATHGRLRAAPRERRTQLDEACGIPSTGAK